MTSYDPRVLATRLEISRNYNLEMVRRYEQLKADYDRLMEQYTELVKHYVMDKKDYKTSQKSTQTQ